MDIPLVLLVWYFVYPDEKPSIDIHGYVKGTKFLILTSIQTHFHV